MFGFEGIHLTVCALNSPSDVKEFYCTSQIWDQERVVFCPGNFRLSSPPQICQPPHRFSLPNLIRLAFLMALMVELCMNVALGVEENI